MKRFHDENVFDIFNRKTVLDSVPLKPFAYIATTYATEFAEILEGADDEYIFNYSSHKALSNVARLYLEKYGMQPDATNYPDLWCLDDDGVMAIADMAWHRFGDNWSREYAVLSAEYQPLENYRMEETVTPDTSKKFKASNDYKVTDSEESDFKQTTDNTGTDSKQEVFAFNSSTTGIPVGNTHVEGTIEVSGSSEDNKVTREHTQAGYTEETESGTVETERSGNIGVTTSQQMLESEIALRARYTLFELMFRDMDKILTSRSYRHGISHEIIDT